MAEKLFVSRTAISKWESGRGYPSIDSLKIIAKYFNITIDELIGSEEIISLAEQDKKDTKKKYTALICGILDSLIVLLMFLPLFGNGGDTAVSMFSLTDNYNHGAHCAERLLRRYNKQLRQACMEQTQDHYGYRIVRYRNSIICRDKAAIRRSILSLRAHNKRLFAAEKQMTRSVSAM